MSQAPLKTKKHLDFTALRHAFSKHFVDIEDHRCEPRCTHTLHDAFMSGFACMFFQDPSPSHFQQRMEETEKRNNLRILFDVATIPRDTQLRDVIDSTQSEALRPVFKQFCG